MCDERDFKTFKSTHHNGADIAKILKKQAQQAKNATQIQGKFIKD